MKITPETIKLLNAGIPLILNFGTIDGVCRCYRHEDCKSPGKHPLGGEGWTENALLTSVEELKNAMLSEVDVNLGIALGHPMKDGRVLFAIDVDIDGAHEGAESVAALESEGKTFTPTLTDRTGGGGQHRYLAAPAGSVIGNGKPRPGIDIKGLGGQVVVAPSRTDKGEYRWETWMAIADADEWELELAREGSDGGTYVHADTVKNRDELTDAELVRCDREEQRIIDDRVAFLQRLKSVPINGKPRWSAGVYGASKDLFRLAGTPWAQMTSSAAESLVMANAPTDSGYSRSQMTATMRSGARAVVGEAYPMPEDTGGRVEITTTGRNEADLADEIAAVLVQRNSELPTLFRRGSGYVEINEGIKDVGIASLAYLSARSITYTAVNADGDERQSKAPWDVLRGLVEGQRIHVPKLVGVVEVPFFTPTGKLWSRPGYCPEAGLWYEPSVDVREVTLMPSADEIAEARGLIEEMIAEFPFVGNADRAVWYCVMLQPFIRSMILGPTPMYMFEAPTSRTGKSLALELALKPGIATVGFTVFPTNEEELVKVLMSELKAGKQAIVFDNVVDTITDGRLNAFITAYPNFSARLLGTNETPSLPNTALVAATANNPRIGRDLAGRVVVCRQDARLEHPEIGRIFKIPNILAWAEEKRGELIWSALTLVQGWVAAGAQRGPSGLLGGFESWSEVMGGICEWIGLENPSGDREAIRAGRDSASGAWYAFVDAWVTKLGSTVYHDKFMEPTTSELMGLIEENDIGFNIASNSELGRKQRLGKLLASQTGVIIKGASITSRQANGKTRYTLEGWEQVVEQQKQEAKTNR